MENIKEETDLIAFEDVMRLKKNALTKLHKKEPQSNLTKQCSASNFGPIRVTTKDHIDSGLPLLTVEIYLFPNSGESVVRILLPHCVFDASNMSALFRAWSDTLNGKFENVPTVLTFGQVPQSIKAVTKQEQNRRPKLYGKARYADPFPVMVLLFGLLFRWIILPLLRFRKPFYQKGVTIFVPEKVFKEWREEARGYAEQNGHTKDTFLSDNDLYTCWALQKMAKRTNILDGYFTLDVAFNLRTQSKQLAQKMGIDLESGSLTKSLQKAKSVFLHNGIVGLGIGTYLWRDVKRWPKWAIAYKIREEVIENRKPENSEKLAEIMGKVHHNHISQGLPTIIPFDPKSLFVMSTSWKQSNLFQSIDFSSVIEKSSIFKPQNLWSSTVSLGKVSDMAVTDEKSLQCQPPIFATVATLGERPGKGTFVTVFCDPLMIKNGDFGRHVNLSDV